MLLHRRNFGEVDLVCERLGTSLISPGIRAGWAHFGLRGQAANLGTGLSSGSLREHLSRKAEDESGGAPSDSFHLSGCESLRPSHESWGCYAAMTVHYTMGGVRISPTAEVLNTRGDPIPGLWAAGEVTGGIHGVNRMGANGVNDALVFGRIAGQNAARHPAL